jgi:hypothetical protein
VAAVDGSAVAAVVVGGATTVLVTVTVVDDDDEVLSPPVEIEASAATSKAAAPTPNPIFSPVPIGGFSGWLTAGDGALGGAYFSVHVLPSKYRCRLGSDGSGYQPGTDMC